MPSRHWEQVEVWKKLYPSSAVVVERSGLSLQRSGHDIPGKETRCPLYRRLGGLGGPDLNVFERCFPALFKPLYRPAGSETLYGLHYPSSPFCRIRALNTVPTQSASVNTKRRDTQNALAKWKQNCHRLATSPRTYLVRLAQRTGVLHIVAAKWNWIVRQLRVTNCTTQFMK
jgi:hypothetical protein